MFDKAYYRIKYICDTPIRHPIFSGLVLNPGLCSETPTTKTTCVRSVEM